MGEVEVSQAMPSSNLSYVKREYTLPNTTHLQTRLLASKDYHKLDYGKTDSREFRGVS